MQQHDTQYDQETENRCPDCGRLGTEYYGPSYWAGRDWYYCAHCGHCTHTLPEGWMPGVGV